MTRQRHPSVGAQRQRFFGRPQTRSARAGCARSPRMFAVGWPRVLASPAAGAGEAAVALEHDARADAVALVTRASVEVWNGGRHRTRAGGFARSPATVAEEGAYVAARWRDGGEVLAVAAEGGVVHLFDVAFFQDPPSAAPVPGATARRCRLVPRRVAIRLGGAPSASTTPRGGALSPVREEDEDEDAVPAGASRDGACVSLAGDARVLLVGTSTGRVARCDWDFGRGFLGGDAAAASSSSIPGAGVLGRTDRLANAGGALVDLDYAPALRVVVAVAASGACVASLFSFGRPSASAAAFSSDDRAADPRAPIRRRDPNAAGRDPNVVDASKCARAPGVANATRARGWPPTRAASPWARRRATRRFFPPRSPPRRRGVVGVPALARAVAPRDDRGRPRVRAARRRRGRGRRVDARRVGVRRRVGARRVRRVDPVGVSRDVRAPAARGRRRRRGPLLERPLLERAR